jgi:hypothetical protein
MLFNICRERISSLIILNGRSNVVQCMSFGLGEAMKSSFFHPRIVLSGIMGTGGQPFKH